MYGCRFSARTPSAPAKDHLAMKTSGNPGNRSHQWEWDGTLATQGPSPGMGACVLLVWPRQTGDRWLFIN